MGVLRRLAFLLAFSLSVVACGEPGLTETSEPPAAASTTRPPFGTMPPLESGGGTPAAVPDGHWQAILDDLSTRNVPIDDVVLLEALEVTWNDGSLGCPQPGASYTQALVDGMKIVVEADGARYEYHFGGAERPTLCVDGRPG